MDMLLCPLRWFALTISIFSDTITDMKVDADKLISAFSFDAKRYKEYADKERREEGETQNYARLCGLADGFQRALDYVKKVMEK